MTKDLLTMRIKCLQCVVSGSVSNALIGKRVRCPKCEKVFLLTEENSPPLLKKAPQKDPSIGEVSGCTCDFDLSHQGITTHKGISRIDQTEKRTHGWYARVRFKGKSHPKFFSDGKFGDKNVSLHAAIKWRDETETTLGIVRIDRQVLKKCESLTGEVGVRFNYKLGRYEVSWVTAEGKQGKTSVSIRKYGKNNALEIAQKIRKEKEAERLSHSNYKQPFQNSLPSEQPLEPSYKDESVDHGQKLMAISDDAPTSITIRKKVRGKIEL